MFRGLVTIGYNSVLCTELLHSSVLKCAECADVIAVVLEIQKSTNQISVRCTQLLQPSVLKCVECAQVPGIPKIDQSDFSALN